MPWGTVLCIYRKKIGNICKNNGFVIPSDAIFHLLMATHCSYITIIDYLRFIFWYNIEDLKNSNPMRLKPFHKKESLSYSMQQNWHSSLNYLNTYWKNINWVIIKSGKLLRTQQNVLTVNRGYIIDTSFKCVATFSVISCLHALRIGWQGCMTI